MDSQLDSFTIKDFEILYGRSRSNINNRIKGLSEKGYPMQAEKRHGENVYNGEQKVLMDALDQHLKAGDAIASFPDSEVVLQDDMPLSYETQGGQDTLIHAPQNRPDLSRQGKAGKAASLLQEQTDGRSLALFTGVIDAIASKVLEVSQLQRQPSTDPLSALRSLQEACDKGWKLNSSHLKQLLSLKTLPTGESFQRFGFTLTRSGRNGAQIAWKVSQG